MTRIENPLDNNVSSAFEILLEEVEAEIDLVCNLGAKAFSLREYNKVEEIGRRAGTLTSFRDRVDTLRSEWNQMVVASGKDEDEETKVERQKHRRLQHGLRTPEESFYIAILATLHEMGGAGEAAGVLDAVGARMKPILKEVDVEPLASDPTNPRWRNTATWARRSMVIEGLLKGDSKRGVWEITDRGIELLESQGSAEG